MLVVNRYVVDPDDEAQFVAEAQPALRALAARPGFVSGRVGRSTDETSAWVMVTEWASVGAYRRALGGYEVKLHAVPLMYRAVDEPSAYEVLLEHTGEGIATYDSDRAADSLGRPVRREPPS